LNISLPPSTPIIDWKGTIKKYKNEKFARSLLTLFSKDLPKLQAQMKKEYQEKHLSNLARTIHHIHGSCCFCVAPQLEMYSSKLEAQLEKKEYALLKEYIDELDMLINQVLIAIKPYLLRKNNKKES